MEEEISEVWGAANGKHTFALENTLQKAEILLHGGGQSQETPALLPVSLPVLLPACLPACQGRFDASGLESTGLCICKVQPGLPQHRAQTAALKRAEPTGGRVVVELRMK